jgi:hypothetical protein
MTTPEDAKPAPRIKHSEDPCRRRTSHEYGLLLTRTIPAADLKVRRALRDQRQGGGFLGEWAAAHGSPPPLPPAVLAFFFWMFELPLLGFRDLFVGPEPLPAEGFVMESFPGIGQDSFEVLFVFGEFSLRLFPLRLLKAFGACALFLLLRLVSGLASCRRFIGGGLYSARISRTVVTALASATRQSEMNSLNTSLERFKSAVAARTGPGICSRCARHSMHPATIRPSTARGISSSDARRFF